MEQNLELALSKTILKNEDQYIFIEPVCDFFGFSFRNQHRVITKDHICKTDCTKKYNELLFGDKRLRWCVGKRAFIRWIQIINVQLVRTELRDLFIQYQVAVFDYLYYGDEFKTAQLEDIRNYVENINSAIKVNRQVMEYIAEQKQHRDLCMASPPNEWAKIKLSLIEEKELPESTDHLKAIGDDLPNDIDELKRLKHFKQTYILRNNNKLMYSSTSVQKKENPMPEGYRKEILKLNNREHQAMIERIEQKLSILVIKQLQQRL